MNNIWLNALISTAVVSALSLVGIFFFTLKTGTLHRIVFLLVSFAVGGLLGTAFFHLLPESFKQIGNHSHIGLLVMAGFLIFFIMEKMLHHHNNTLQDTSTPEPKAYGYLSLYADAIHNFTDGVLVAGGWMVSPEIGLTTTFAVILHEIPHEISNYGILIHAGFKKGKALLFNFYAACSAILGTILTLLFGSHIDTLAVYILPFAGGFIYLAASSLIPELQKENSARNTLIQTLLIIAGILFMFFFNGHSH